MIRLIALINALHAKYKFARYLVVGATNTLICSFIMYVGALMGLGYLTYTAIGYFVGIVLSFFMNLHFTFRVQGQIAQRLMMFFSINITNLLLVELIDYVLIESFLINNVIAIMCGMIWYMTTGFLLNNYLVYRKKMGLLHE